MARILKIDPNTSSCTIGMDNGGVRIVHVNEIDYDYPMVGDFVDVVERDHDVLITKRAKPSTASTAQAWSTTSDGTGPQVDYSQWPQPEPASYSQQPAGKPVNKVAYILFAILLGDFGAHKFFAGKIALGILYLCFFWTFVPALIGIVEGIIAITKPADENGNIYLT